MKKVLIGVVVIVLLLVGGVVIAGLVMPTTYEIERSVAISATTSAIHVHVGDLEKWPAWAPWEEDDPSIVTTYGEKTVGAGASQTWTGKEGDGELTLTKSDPNSGIAYDMVFIMDETRAPASCAMSYEADGESTTVTWTMEGDAADYMPPVIGGVVTWIMKLSINGMFDRGLENLKKTVESSS